MHDKPPNYPHSTQTIHIYVLAMPIYVVIITATILLTLILGFYIFRKLKSCKFTNSSLNGRELFSVVLSHICSISIYVPTGNSKMKVEWTLFTVPLHKPTGNTFKWNLCNADTLMGSCDQWLAVQFWYVTDICMA
jgi:hypothetical protein